jgi:hypothetical protein
MQKYLTFWKYKPLSALPSVCILLATMLLAIPNASTAEEKKLYRWVDSEGNVEYSDKIPPEVSRKERAILNEKGMQVETLEAAKTAAQIAEEKRQTQIREEQRAIAEKQAAYDHRLLTTYDNVEGLARARDAKITFIENIIIASKSTLRLQETKLVTLRKNAADHERSGEEIPDKILKEIESVKKQIISTELYIADKRREQAAIRDAFEKDIQHYQTLKKDSKQPQATRP